MREPECTRAGRRRPYSPASARADSTRELLVSPARQVVARGVVGPAFGGPEEAVNVLACVASWAFLGLVGRWDVQWQIHGSQNKRWIAEDTDPEQSSSDDESLQRALRRFHRARIRHRGG